MSDNGLLARFAPRHEAASKPLAGAEPPREGDHEEAPGDAFRCMRGGHKAVGLRFIFLGGGDCTLPYGFLPTTWKGPDNSILIEYPKLTVHLKGRNLEELRTKIDEHRVSQVREMEEMQAKALSVVVTRIEIVDWFPSKAAPALKRLSGDWPKPAQAENAAESLHIVTRETRSATGKG